ncbi:hypothetical protein Tco_1575811 [Tanacetum coccineum]
MDRMISLGQKNTLAEYMILFGADNRPPMLDKDLYDSWKSRMELYMQNREHGRMILESVEHGPLIWPTVEENGVIRTKKYAELSAAEKIQADCDMKATNIILQGLPTDIYSLERECKLYDAFDKFTHIKGESLHTYYLRFTQLINDMNIYKMKMEQFQVNTKFLNSLPPEWSKFVTDVKLVKDLHTSNFDQLHAYLEQHKLHANEIISFLLLPPLSLLLREVTSFWKKSKLTNDSIPLRIDDADFDPEGDLLLLDKLLNDDPSSPLPPKELHFKEIKMIKSSIDDPSELELKDLPSHL